MQSNFRKKIEDTKLKQEMLKKGTNKKINK